MSVYKLKTELLKHRGEFWKNNSVFLFIFRRFFLDFRREITEKLKNEQKRLKTAQKKYFNQSNTQHMFCVTLFIL